MNTTLIEPSPIHALSTLCLCYVCQLARLYCQAVSILERTIIFKFASHHATLLSLQHQAVGLYTTVRFQDEAH